MKRAPRAIPVLVLTLVLLAPGIARAGEVLSTEASLLIGFPHDGDGGTEGVLVVPGTVIPLGTGRTGGSGLLDEEASHGQALSKVAKDLEQTLRLSEVQVSYRDRLLLEVGETDELPPPSATSPLTIRVELLGLSERSATYRVQFLEAGRPLADTRVAATRGQRAIVGGLDGEEAPYLFLVLAPASPGEGPHKVDPEAGYTPPRIVHRIVPRYTEEARKEKVQGLVIVRTVIDTSGKIEDVEVLQGQPHGLSEAAVEAIRQWRFEPALDPDGKPVKVYYNLTIAFRLDEETEEGKASRRSAGREN